MDISHLTKNIEILPLVKVLVLLIIGLPALHFFCRFVRNFITKKYSAQQGMVVAKVLYYAGLGLIAITIFHELGFSLAPLLGAAGIVGVALGFASQTSVSNIISGIFLVAEQPFVVDDIINVGETTGQVLSIDTLSVKLRTFDNRFVRIPNETIVKSQVINMTHFPIRRFDLNLRVAYKEDISKVRKVLLEVATKNAFCLQEPQPIVRFSSFGDSAIELIFIVWSVKEEWLKFKSSIQEEVKIRFDEEGIEIPFPHISIYTGSESKAFPLKVDKDKK